MGAVVGVLLIAIAAYFLWRHRRAQRGAGGGHGEGDGAPGDERHGGQYANASELADPADSAVWKTHAEMATGQNLAELPADPAASPVEVPGQSRFVEAPS